MKGCENLTEHCSASTSFLVSKFKKCQQIYSKFELRRFIEDLAGEPQNWKSKLIQIVNKFVDNMKICGQHETVTAYRSKEKSKKSIFEEIHLEYPI